MKIKQTGEVITISLGFVNIYLIKGNEGYALVDGGIDPSGKEIHEAMESLGIEASEIKLIILTHAHVDHTAAVGHMKEFTGAKLLCHKSCAVFMAQGESEPATPHGFLGKLVQRLSPAGKINLKGVEPDILVEESFELKELGFNGRVIHTPGHTSGSISLILNSGDALLGDMIRGNGRKINLPLFYEDKTLLETSARKIIELASGVIYLSHGNETDRESLKALVG